MPRAPETVQLTHVADLDLSAGSGLVRRGDELVVVADDRLSLSRYGIDGTPRGTIRLFEGELPDDPIARKQVKPDLEALVDLPGGLLVVPSGSKRRRHRGAWIPAGRGARPGAGVREVDFGPLYETLRADFDRLNVEGAALVGGHLALFTRRTGRVGRNALVRLRLLDVLATLAMPHPRLTDAALVDVTDVALGDEGGTPYGFTDAFGDGDGAVFVAAAEATDDPVRDGHLAGCILGRLDATLRVCARWAVAPRSKVEGIAPDGSGGLWAVADADNPQVPAPLLHLARLPA